jgi:NAD(P)-dependent dehydrogenase (short-subunit alcohol dehydrogenase family)
MRTSTSQSGQPAVAKEQLPVSDPTPLASLAGQHAVVTGGSRGIGAAIATELARLGANLTLLGRNLEPLTGHAESLSSAFGVLAQPWAVDVTDEGAVARAFRSVMDGLGPASILVNNAGAAHSAPIRRLDLHDWRRMLDVNLTAAFLCCREVVPAMTGAGYGRIVNIASTAGLKGYAYVAAYVAAKHGLVGLTRALAVELARTGVTVNAVCPGFTDTDLLAASIDTIVSRTGRSADEARADLARFNPQGRLIAPEEVARAVAWLCLPGSGSISGQAIVVAGGEVM